MADTEENIPHPAGRGASIGRPRKFDNETLLDQALELFWHKGFGNTTTRDLEAALQLNQSSLYKHFGSKKHFFTQVLDHYESLTSAALILPLESSAGGIAAIEIYFTNLVDWITRDGRRGCMLINLMAEDGGADKGFSDRATAYRNRVRRALRQALQAAADNNEIEAGDNDSRAMILIGLTLGLNIAARSSPATEEIEQLSLAIRMQLRSWRKKAGN